MSYFINPHCNSDGLRAGSLPPWIAKHPCHRLLWIRARHHGDGKANASLRFETLNRLTLERDGNVKLFSASSLSVQWEFLGQSCLPINQNSSAAQSPTSVLVVVLPELVSILKPLAKSIGLTNFISVWDAKVINITYVIQI